MKTSITATLQKKNERYHIVISYKQDGVWKQHWESTKLPIKGNQRRAKRMLEEALQIFRKEAEEEARLEGWGYAVVVKDMLFADYLLLWRDRKRIDVAVSTQQGYEMVLHYAEPFFRKLGAKVKEVTPPMIERYYAFLMDKEPHPLSPNTVRKHATLLKSAFNDAIKDGQLEWNPARRAKEPPVVPYNANTYSAEQIKYLLKRMEGHSLEDVVWLAAFYGLRRSEICGLRWQDIDFEQNILYVRHKVMQAHVDGKKVIEKSNALKTQSSRRAFPLLPALKERLLKRQDYLEQCKQLFGKGYDQENLDYVFVQADGSLLQPDQITNRFRSYIAYHDDLPKIRFHDLRHPYVKPTTKNKLSSKAEIPDYQSKFGSLGFLFLCYGFAHSFLEGV